MTQMELSNGGAGNGADSTATLAHGSGDDKVVPHCGDGDVLFPSVNKVSTLKINGGDKAEKIMTEYYDEDNSSGNSSDQVDTSSEDSIDDYREKLNISSKVRDESFPATEKNGVKINGGDGQVHILIPPNSQLPMPEPPPGATMKESQISSEKVGGDNETSSIGKYFMEKSSSLSLAITKRLYSVTESTDSINNFDINNGDLDNNNNNNNNVAEFNLLNSKTYSEVDYDAKTTEFRGRITFFSKSNCRDCTAVRSFFREKNLRYVEINIDVFPLREKELIARTGSSSVPQIFFNEKLFGGLVALNSLRNSDMLDEKLKELLFEKCPETAPVMPVYGFDDPEEERMDEMVGIVRVLRQNLVVQDRLMKMTMVRNCFSGAELVDEILKHFAGLDRLEAVEIGKQLAQKNFIHQVFGEKEFEDGSHYYRFLEHEPFISRCFNYQGSINDSEPKAAALISQRLAKLMSAILESYASDDRQHLNYVAISSSEEFRRYVNLVQCLHRVNLSTLSAEQKLAFFLNLYNAMVIHAVIKVGHPVGLVDRRSFNSDFLYVIGGQPYSVSAIKNGILRSNRRAPYSLAKHFGAGDKRLELAVSKVNPSIHFGLCNGTRSSPVVRFFTPQGVDSELRFATREFFKRDGIEVDLATRTVYLTRIINWFSADFGQENEMLQWMMKYVDATKAGLLTHLLGDGGPINIVYQDYDWSLNSCIY